MFGSGILDIVISLVFVYLLLSLLGSATNELIMTLFNSRGKDLVFAIDAMLRDQSGHEGNWLSQMWTFISQHLFGFRFNKDKRKEINAARQKANNQSGAWLRYRAIKEKQGEQNQRGEQVDTIAELFFINPLLNKLCKPGSIRFPSYISPTNFSKVLSDVLDLDPAGSGTYSTSEVEKKLDELLNTSAAENPQDNAHQTRTLLLNLARESKGSVAYFRSEIEQWFDDTMYQATAWYKRRSQIALFIIGIGISIVFNADSIQIFKTLNDNPEVRMQIVAMAVDYAKAQQDITRTTTAGADSAQVAQLAKGLQNFYDAQAGPTGKLLGLGWDKAAPEASEESGLAFVFASFKRFLWWLLTPLGWAITALAITFGAPFWFDLLNKLVNLRSTSHRPRQSSRRTQAPVG